jgi:hypothetical protein
MYVNNNRKGDEGKTGTKILRSGCPLNFNTPFLVDYTNIAKRLSSVMYTYYITLCGHLYTLGRKIIPFIPGTE